MDSLRLGKTGMVCEELLAHVKELKQEILAPRLTQKVHFLHETQLEEGSLIARSLLGAIGILDVNFFPYASLQDSDAAGLS
jgi:hypothetical protein